jgi:hypothetical protein
MSTRRPRLVALAFALLLLGLLGASAQAGAAKPRPAKVRQEAAASSADRGPVIEFWDGTSWTQQADPIPGGFGLLSAITARSADDAWAVGSHTSEVGALAEHWNGSSWQQVAVPSPSGAKSVSLSGVAEVSPANVWAVGEWFGKRKDAWGEDASTLVEHWDGSSWTIIPSLPPRGSATLSAVAPLSATNIWAVGGYETHPGGLSRTLVLHWNGTAWKRVASPHPGSGQKYSDSSLSGVAAISSKSAWAVGTYLRIQGRHHSYQTLTLQWNGRNWKRVPSPNARGGNGLTAVAVAGRNNAWAVGGHWNGVTGRLLTEHWNGHAWRILPAQSGYPDSDGQILTSVTTVPGGGVLAAGLRSYEDAQCYYGIIERGNEHGWSPVTAPDLFAAQFSGIAAASPTAVWILANFAEEPCSG